MDMSILRSDCLSTGRGTIKENTISFRAVWQRWAPLYITLRMGTFTGRAWRGGKWGVGPDAQGHLSNPCDAGRNLITRDNNGGIMLGPKCTEQRKVSDCKLLNVCCGGCLPRHRCSAGLLFSHLAEPSNRYCICCQRSPVWRIDTAQGTWGEFDLPSGHRMGTSSGKSPQELSAWKENETQDVSLKVQYKLKSPLKSPKSELFAIVWVRNSLQDRFAGFFNENLILILEWSFLLIADFNDNFSFFHMPHWYKWLSLSFKGLCPLR